MADFWEKSANDNQSQPRLGSALADLVGGGPRLADDFVGQVLAAATLELAAHRSIGRLRIGAAAHGGGTNVALAKDIARADDPRARTYTIMRTIRKWQYGHSQLLIRSSGFFFSACSGTTASGAGWPATTIM